MSPEEALVAEKLEAVDPKWWDDFCRLVEGKEVSRDFLDYFDQNRSCQQAFEETLRILDAPVIDLLAEEKVR